MINAAVLTISDSVSAGTRVDRSGPAVRERLEQLGWSVAVMEAIPDVISEISERLATLSDGGQVAAIFTTGGTGVAPRDVTPEATRAILDREIPGFGELMRLQGRAATPLAVLSRSLAGTRGQGSDRDSARVAQGGGGIPGCYRGIGTTRARTAQRAYRAHLNRSCMSRLILLTFLCGLLPAQQPATAPQPAQPDSDPAGHHIPRRRRGGAGAGAGLRPRRKLRGRAATPPVPPVR